jgi:hypothetical protein
MRTGCAATPCRSHQGARLSATAPPSQVWECKRKCWSPGAQREAIAAFAKSQGYELVELVEDAAVSGASDPSHRAAWI